MARLRMSGFTLVELIVVILLISIVSLYATSRYSGRAGFSPYAAQERVISVIRQVQLNRMQSNIDIGSSTDTSNFSLNISSNCIGSVAGCAAQSQGRSDWVAADLDDNGDNDVTFSRNSAAVINFDLRGNPSSATLPIIIKMTSSDGTCAAVQINAIGYVSAEDC